MQHLSMDFRDNVPDHEYPENYVAVIFNAAFTTAEVSFKKNDWIPLKLIN